MKSKWRLFFFVGLILLLTNSVVGCAESYTQEDLDATYETGHTEGYEIGYDKGYETGSLEGYEIGHTDGKDSAITEFELDKQGTETVSPPSSTPPPSVPVVPAQFVLGDLTITPAVVSTGEIVTISIPVSNTGNAVGNYAVVFQVERFDKTTSVKEVTLNPGQTKTVTFTTTIDVFPQDTLLNSLQAIYQVNVNGKVGQFTVTAPPPAPVEPTPEEIEAEQVIEDLAYIKTFVWNYSDDADPEYEGISISVDYYNSRSEKIRPNGVVVEVTVELYWYTNYPSIYQNQFTVEYPEYSGLFIIPVMEEVVRIPFEGIQEKPRGMNRGPVLILTVNTPNQGNFTVEETIIGFTWP